MSFVLMEEVSSFSLNFLRVRKGIIERRVVRYVICFYTKPTFTLRVLVCLQCKNKVSLSELGIIQAAASTSYQTCSELRLGELRKCLEPFNLKIYTISYK